MPFWCDGSVRLLCGQNVNDSMWAIVGNEKLYEFVYGVQNRKTRRKFYFFVVSKSSQFRVGKHIGVNFWRFRESTKLLKLLNYAQIEWLQEGRGQHFNRVPLVRGDQQLLLLVQPFFFLWRALKLDFVCICRIGGSCNQKVRYGKIQKQQDR